MNERIQRIRKIVYDDYNRISGATNPFDILNASHNDKLEQIEEKYERYERFYRAENFQRLGDIDGPDAPSPPIIDRGASSYIDPISLSGADVLRIPAGRWRVFMYSTHQAMGSKEGFMHGFARTTHIATYVPLGDVNGDQDVNVTDLLSVITDWGPCGDCLADLDGDGQVNVSDLLQVISDWS